MRELLTRPRMAITGGHEWPVRPWPVRRELGQWEREKPESPESPVIQPYDNLRCEVADGSARLSHDCGRAATPTRACPTGPLASRLSVCLCNKGTGHCAGTAGRH